MVPPRQEEKKDLGVKNDLSTDNHVAKIRGNISKMLNNIRLAFQYTDKDMIKELCQ